MSAEPTVGDKPRPCDLLVRNAYVVTMDATGTVHPLGAIAIEGRDIVAIGPERDLSGCFAAR